MYSILILSAFKNQCFYFNVNTCVSQFMFTGFELGPVFQCTGPLRL